MRALIASVLVALAFLAGCATSSSDPTPGAGVTTTPPQTSGPPARIRIPALQVDARIIELGLQGDGKMQVPPDAQDAGWYTGSPTPGEIGPAVIAAHVNWKGVDGPFAKLDQLKAGDRVDVEQDNGATVSFTVDRVERHPKTAFPHDAVYGDTAGPELRLVTCGGAFDPGSGHYLDNTIVWAKLAT